MEDKRFPGSDNYGQNNEDEYSPLEETAEEIDDDDLDLSELLKKYMRDGREIWTARRNAAEAFGSGADSEEALAESVDASEYGEFASEIYSDETHAGRLRLTKRLTANSARTWLTMTADMPIMLRTKLLPRLTM